jgi:hypothetical protein
MGELKNDRIARYLEKIHPDMEPMTLEELFQRMADGETLYEVCRAWDVPTGRVLTWLMADEKRHAMYLRALEVAAHGLVAQTVEIADEQPGQTASGGTDAGAVAHAKLRIETRFKVAAAHAKQMYGGKDVGGGGITVVVNRGHKSGDSTDGTDPPPPGIENGIRVSADGRTLTVEA